ncbi:MAG: hypothetical protein PUP93_17420 [Rhizonema sp. NSF051]|nr:hypothetical protein [Rhizonema sp. NSF051]
MINSTQTIRILSINESFDSLGVKVVSGYCSFNHYSKDGVVEENLAYRAKGAPAMSISSLQATGVAIGYLDLRTIDNGTYKSKVATLVIRSFIPTATVVESETAPTQAIAPVPVAPVKKPQPRENRQLVGAGVAASNGKGRLSVVDINTDDIPF